MALSGFEIAVGGIASIPVLGGLVFLGYKAFGEKNLDASKLKPKKPAATDKKAAPAADKKAAPTAANKAAPAADKKAAPTAAKKAAPAASDKAAPAADKKAASTEG